MTARGTAALVGILAVLGAWLWLVELRPRSAPPPPATLLAVEEPRIGRVELTGPAGRLVARRHDGRWTDDAGRPWPDGVVPEFLGTLRTLPPIMVVDAAPRHAADYGLDEAATHLSVADAGGRTLLALYIGGANPAGTDVYARRAGDAEVILVGGLLAWEIRKLREAAP
jgi:hypothetical protein